MAKDKSPRKAAPSPKKAASPPKAPKAAPKATASPESATDAPPRAESNGPATVAAGPPKRAPGIDREIHQAANLLKQLADPTRLQVVLLLAGGPMNVGQLTGALGMRQPALSHHLALMRHGRLVAPVRDGKMSFYELTEIGRTLVGVCRTMTEASM